MSLEECPKLKSLQFLGRIADSFSKHHRVSGDSTTVPFRVRVLGLNCLSQTEDGLPIGYVRGRRRRATSRGFAAFDACH
jgi:hypothetical protein